MTNDKEMLYKCHGCGCNFPAPKSMVETFAREGFYCPACLVKKEQGYFNKITDNDSDLFK